MMQVLMITQRVDEDHDVLGFTTDWIAALANHVDHLHVLAGYEGRHDLPANVTVHSYGKERGLGKFRRVLRFESRCATLARKVDAAFVHMIPKFVLAGWPWFQATGTPVILWYAHSSVTWDLKLAHELVDRVVTPTEASFRLSSDKLHVLGHGIDMDRFEIPQYNGRHRERLLYVGRVDPVKNVELLVETLGHLDIDGADARLRIVGEPTHEDDYLDQLRSVAQDHNVADAVTLVGSVSHKAVVKEYQQAGVFLNASQTGSLDKTEVEAMATGTPTLSSNDSFRDMVQSSKLDTGLLTFEPGDAADLARTVEQTLQLSKSDYIELGKRCRRVVEERHSVDSLMASVASLLSDVS